MIVYTDIFSDEEILSDAFKADFRHNNVLRVVKSSFKVILIINNSTSEMMVKSILVAVTPLEVMMVMAHQTKKKLSM